MKQILQHLRSGETRLEDVPAPGVEPGHLLIRNIATLVSQGTEKMLVQFGKASLFQKARSQPDKVKQVLAKIRSDGLRPTLEAVFRKLDEPMPLGYCAAGEVIGVGAGVVGFALGDRVACNGSHAEVVTVPANLVAKVPACVSDEAAAFTVIGAIGLEGIRLARPELGETFVVIGLGLIGQITAQLLKAHGCRVIGFDWVKEKTFPVSYLNLPAIRMVSLKYGYFRALHQALRTPDRRSLIVCYNANMWTSHLAKRSRERYGIPAICLHLDFPDMHGDWSEFSRLSGEFAGNVFGSYGAYMQSPVGNKFHLDGGFACRAVRNRLPVTQGAIAYAGNISVGKGVGKLVSCFKKLPGEKLRLVLFGKVDGRDGGSEILRACTSDRRIEYRGVVTYEELEEALASSAVLVNPVDVKMRGNPLNFPSKLLHYLEMGPPIVSALVDGIAPAYRDLMYCVERDEDEAEWACRILEAAGEASEVRRKRIEKVETFLGEHLWEKQLERLVDWVETWRRPALSAK